MDASSGGWVDPTRGPANHLYGSARPPQSRLAFGGECHCESTVHKSQRGSQSHTVVSNVQSHLDLWHIPSSTIRFLRLLAPRRPMPNLPVIFGFSPGPMELIIIAVIVLLLFGNRLPGVMRSLGKGVVEFKKGVSGVDDEPPAEKSNEQAVKGDH